MSPHFKEIGNKVSAFMELAGLFKNHSIMKDIVDEIVDTIKAALADGYTWEKFKADCEQFVGQPMPEDEMANMIRQWFETAKLKMEAPTNRSSFDYEAEVLEIQK